MWPFNKIREEVNVLPEIKEKETDELKMGENWIAEGNFGLIIVQIEKPDPNPWRIYKGRPIQLPFPVKIFNIEDSFYFLVRGELRNLEYLLIVRGEEVLKGDITIWQEKFNFFKNCYFTVERLQACD